MRKENLSFDSNYTNLEETLDLDSMIGSSDQKEFYFEKDIFFSSLIQSENSIL